MTLIFPFLPQHILSFAMSGLYLLVHHGSNLVSVFEWLSTPSILNKL